MATDALTAAILQGLDPGTYRSLSDIQQGNALQQIGQDASPTSKWGAIGRLANAAAGTYLSNSATSDLAKTIAGGKKSAQDQLLAAIEAQSAAASPRSSPVPMGAPAQAAPSPMAAPAAPPQAAAAPTMSQAAPMQPAVPAPAGPYDPATFKAQADQLAARTAQPAVPLDAPAAPAMAAAPDAASAPPAAIAAIDAMLSGGKTPRGVRNNNPLNIEDGPFAKSQPGYAGSDGRFAKFGAPEHGIAAASSLLDSYDAKHGLNTVAGIVNRWAPPSDGNNTSAYAADVAGKLGIDPNAPVPKELRPQLIAAMASHENGVPFKVAQAAPQTMNDATSAEAPAAAARSGGFDTHKLLAVLQNPYTDDSTKALVSKLLAAQLTPVEDSYGVTGEDAFGGKKYGFVNTKEHTINGQPADQAAAAKASGGMLDNIDSTKTGKDYLAQFPSETQASVMDYLNGHKMPTGNPRRQDVVRSIASKVGAEIGLPADDTAFSERKKLRTDLGSSSPNSMGGILSNGKSSFAHLADASDRMTALGNYNGPNTVGGAMIGDIGNRVGNALGTPDTAAKITGVRDNLLKYGQEATKFYAGTGGGEAERMNALKTMDPTSASSKQMAEFLETEKGLMIDRMAQKESQIKGTLGQDFLDSHPVRTPDFDANIKRIDANIAKLGGSQSGTTAAPTAAASPAVPAIGTVMKGHKFLGGDPSIPSSWQAVP